MLELVDRLVSEASARKLGRESPSLSRGTLKTLNNEPRTMNKLRRSGY